MSKFVAYFISPCEHHQLFVHTEALDEQARRFNEFLEHQSGEHFATFTEQSDPSKPVNRWSALMKAIDHCILHGAHLVLSHSKDFIQQASFNHQLMQFVDKTEGMNVELFCLDQPYLNRASLRALVDFSKQKKRDHAEKVKNGIARSNHGHVGNPKANDIIARVNKHKIDNAIMFAVMFEPVVQEYERKGFTQRKMVNLLNEQGFKAPEGGTWVLSQFQKVLERVHFNQAAVEHKGRLEAMLEKGMTMDDMAFELNEFKIKPPKGKLWSADVVKKTLERIKQLEELQAMNDLLIAMNTLTHPEQALTVTPTQMHSWMKSQGLSMPNAWEQRGSMN